MFNDIFSTGSNTDDVQTPDVTIFADNPSQLYGLQNSLENLGMKCSVKQISTESLGFESTMQITGRDVLKKLDALIEATDDSEDEVHRSMNLYQITPGTSPYIFKAIEEDPGVKDGSSVVIVDQSMDYPETTMEWLSMDHVGMESLEIIDPTIATRIADRVHKKKNPA